MNSAVKWKTHTSTATFAEAFDHITQTYRDNNDLRTTKVEAFLIKEAKAAGVINSTIKREQKNPNRWAKHLAPWYEDTCKRAKYEYKKSKRKHGHNHVLTKQAYTKFKEQCRI